MIRQANFLQQATARQIVQRAMHIIPHSVNVMDSNGVIIASGDPSRLYQCHEGALLALAENRVVEIDSATARQLKGVQPGVNLPFNFRQQRIGAIGISGDPTTVRAYAELVKMAAELMVEQAAMLEQHQWQKHYREALANQLLQPTRQTGLPQELAAYLDWDLQQPLIVWLLELYQPTAVTLQNVFAELQRSQPDALITQPQFNELVLLRPASHKQRHWQFSQEQKQAQQLQRTLQKQCRFRLIVGGFFDAEDAPYRSLQTARAVQNLARQQQLDHSLLFYQQHALPALLCDVAQPWRIEELCRPWQQLAEQDKNGVLRHTLRQYLHHHADLNATASSLHIHINTLRYRLQCIEKKCAIKISRLTELFPLYVGMLFDSNI
ncbi:sugar diacid recognition domain-containing protein [Serratia microhaemolytica]|uniref:sugar diacid recognition domain-containing protein n=1 Tax=Serratia microhaemolytica TaxID=2675110 RepID=UPI000FDCFD50|nr:sugar diacid recognition domain-containing protein [Serratia microhaemolytica]